jgi:hypothetical protein
MKTFQILSLFLIIGNNLLSQPGDYVDENYTLNKKELPILIIKCE